MSIPGEAGGQRSDQPCSLIDVMPTLTEACGLNTPIDADGMSLIPAIRGHTDNQRAIHSEFYEWGIHSGMVQKGPWKYIAYNQGYELLFNNHEDPEEMINRIDDPDCASIVATLEPMVKSVWTTLPPPRSTSSSSIMAVGALKKHYGR